MPAGLQVFNAGGSVQVDQDYRNYHLYEVRQFYCPNSFSGVYTGWGWMDVVGGRADDLIGFMGTGAVYFFAGDYGSFRRYQILKQNGPGYVTVLIFRQGIATGPVNAGLQVFKADGTIAFDSSRPYMRVLDFLYNQGLDRTYAGRTVGIIQLMNAYGVQESPLGDPTAPRGYVSLFNTMTFGTNGSQAMVTYYTYDQIMSQDPQGYESNGSLYYAAMVVDMTGMV
jgi:hypothetical protein